MLLIYYYLDNVYNIIINSQSNILINYAIALNKNTTYNIINTAIIF